MTIPAHRMARCLVPLPDESLPGFALRLGHRLHLPPGHILWRFGLVGVQPTSTLAPSARLHFIDPVRRERFAQIIGVSPQAVDQLTLHPLVRRFPPASHALSWPGGPGEPPKIRQIMPPWILTSFSRYCPLCLVGDGSAVQQRHGGPWRRRWRLATSFACVKHRKFLEHECPGCRKPSGLTLIEGWPGSLQLIGNPGVEDLHPASCRNDAHRGRPGVTCGHRLDQPADQLARPLPQNLADLQSRLDCLLDEETAPEHAFAAFADLQFITAVVLATWPATADMVTADQKAAVDEHVAAQEKLLPGFNVHRPPRDEGVLWTYLPRAPLASAAVLSIADQLLSLPEGELLEELRQLDRRCPERDNKRWGATWKLLDKEASPARRAIVQQTLRRPAPGPRPRIPFSAWSRRQIVTSLLTLAIGKRHDFAPENIPQELPDHWFRIFWTDVDRPFPPYSRRVRRTVAILLVQAAEDMDAQQAAEYLGLPLGTDQPAPPTSQSIPFSFQQRADELRESLGRLADHVAAIPAADRIDYRRRRQQHESWHLNDEAFAELVERYVAANERRPPALADQLQEALSALIWSRVTGSEPCLAPCFRPPFAASGRSIITSDPAIHLARRIRGAGPRSPYWVLLPALAHHADGLLADPIRAAGSGNARPRISVARTARGSPAP
ncbi:TniQ family protein [Kitasatospora sp. RG8]|uniref:TniQ family protein n=1 Tax=Kitasatospora sp. RG8 TaxID=2820815 RepID=UPI001ADF9A8D|nr:TniQ family protein [Kitasatospora sp. RG8]MBP0448133.1 TniQ family protein [Kitasatospora sp. RG8]